MFTSSISTASATVSRFALGFTILFSTNHLGAAEAVHGVFMVVKGSVTVTSSKTGKSEVAKVGTKVFPSDTVEAGKDSRAKVVMIDKNVLNISPETKITIENYEYKPEQNKKSVLLNVIYGKVRASVNQKYDEEKNKFRVKTPSAVAGVRGTDFLTSYNRSNKSSQVVTFSGRVSVGQPGPNGTILNAVMVAPGQSTSMKQGAPPSSPAPVPQSQMASMDKESNAETATEPASGKGGDRNLSSDKSSDEDDSKKSDESGSGKSEEKEKEGDKSKDGKKSENESDKDKDGKKSEKEGDKSKDSKDKGEKKQNESGKDKGNKDQGGKDKGKGDSAKEERRGSKESSASAESSGNKGGDGKKSGEGSSRGDRQPSSVGGGNRAPGAAPGPGEGMGPGMMPALPSMTSGEDLGVAPTMPGGALPRTDMTYLPPPPPPTVPTVITDVPAPSVDVRQKVNLHLNIRVQ